MVDSRNLFDHARLHPSMEILTECPLRGTHICHAVLIPKEITMYNMIVINMMKIILQEHKKVKTIQRILFDYKADCEDLFHKGDDVSDNTLDYKTDGEDLHHEGEATFTAAQRLPIFKQRSNASVHKFQVMLLDIIYKHKASLKIYDDLCHLFYDYSSSSDFDRHARLQSRKSFLRSIEETHCTQGLRPYMALYNCTMIPVLLFRFLILNR